MRAISVHVDEREYEAMKALAERAGRPVAALIRDAMSSYLERREAQAGSVLDLPTARCGGQIRPWTRSEIYDEIYDARREAKSDEDAA